MYSESGGEVRRRRGRRPVQIAVVGALLEALPLWLRGYRFGGRVVVRCRQDHVFTTIWIPGASVKALRLGWWRFQRCPVGHHWSLVTPVRRSDLTWRERRFASRHEDLPVP
jgi:hypothetical protein